MATYNYTNGDGVSALDSSTPDGATEPVSVLDDAIRQIKAYLLDPTKGPQALIDALSGSDVGFIKEYAGASIPSGYLLCDGGAVSRVTYAALFAVIGVTFGVGDGVNTFNVPDKRGRAGYGTGTGDATGATTVALGDKIGEATHVIIMDELPAQAPNLLIDGGSNATMNVETRGNGGNSNTDRGGGSGASNYHTVQVANLGLGTAMNVTGPGLGVHYIIKT